LNQKAWKPVSIVLIIVSKTVGCTLQTNPLL
jgi:hypothetical protein